MFLWVLAAFGRLQSEVGAMAVKGDIIPRGVWAGLGDGVRGRAGRATGGAANAFNLLSVIGCMKLQ